MTVGPAGVGDAVSGQPAAQVAQPVARGNYVPGASNEAPTFTIEGEQVTLDELQGGYMRQRDYTQKTQLLAQQRQQYEAATRLAEALQTDPRGTLLQLAEASGVDLGSLQDPSGQSFNGGVQPGGQQDPAAGLDPNDPVHAELIALREQVQNLSQGFEGMEDHQANAWLDQETASAAQIFEGLDLPFEPEELYQYAAERELTDVGTAAKALAFDKLTELGSGQPGALPLEYQQYATNGQPQQNMAASGGGQPQLGSADRLVAAAQTPRRGMASDSRPQLQPQPGSVQEAFAQTLSDLGIGNLSQVDMTA